MRVRRVEVIPVWAKVVAVGAAAWYALKPRAAKPNVEESGLPATGLVRGGATPVIGERWTLSSALLVTLTAQDARYEGVYEQDGGHLLAVVDSSTWDPSRTSAVVVPRNLAPDLPEVWR